jgi:hypothetical protein
MIWHVVFAEDGELPQSRAARSRDAAIQVACELLDQTYDVRRIIEPDGAFIERAELDEHHDTRRFSRASGGSNGVVIPTELSQQGFCNC